jgi:hypothetical protein
VDSLDLREVELELCRLPEVTAARIVEDDIGRPVEVHILATREKHPKQIVRDVQSVAMATYGLDIDRRVISVVQLEGGSGDEAVVSSNGSGTVATSRGGTPRVVIGDIALDKRQVRCTVRVTLSQGGEDAVGQAEGSIAASARPRLVASATLEALRELVPAVDAADIDAAQIVRVGARDIAVSSIVFVNPPFEETSAGSAPVREPGAVGEHEAVARSVLSALNRRLPHL